MPTPQRSNELAIAADEDYISQCRAQGLYPMAYYPHNLHFLWFAATAEGHSKVGDRSGAQGSFAGQRRNSESSAVARRLSRRALLRADAFRKVGRDVART